MSSEPIYENILLFWGKSRQNIPDTPLFHPTVFHCLDVAAVGDVLVEQSSYLSEPIAEAFELKGNPQELRRLIGFLLSLHDLGKLSRPFLAKIPELWPEAQLGSLKKEASGPRHDLAGWAMWAELSKKGVFQPFENWRLSQTRGLLLPMFCHHGRPGREIKLSLVSVFGKELLGFGQEFIERMYALFRPTSVSASVCKNIPRVSWRLAGLAVLADWLGSNQEWFPYCSPVGLSIEEYWENFARPRARQAVQEAGLEPSTPSQITGYRALTGLDHVPSPVQSWAEQTPLPEGPVLVLIEDMTGGGKTEAAVILAHRLMAAGRASGLYAALPTMATADAFYRRLESIYLRMFSGDGPQPSLSLAHGAASLNPRFRSSVARWMGSLTIADQAEDASPESELNEDHAQGDESGAACAVWLADSRRKAFLADIGAGTIDQAFLAVLPAKFQSLRLLGLTQRVLIVDEAHAYDSYMGAELDALLEFQAGLGGNAIVLSATLPVQRRRDLVHAFRKGLGQAADDCELKETAYPLATLAGRDFVQETPKAARPDLPRSLTVTRLESADDATARIAAAVRTGAAIAWIRNTVEDVFTAAESLETLGIAVSVFHARCALGDRLAIEQDIIRRFGKESRSEQRAGVLIATQVIEQSLDLDFDMMVSDLAPVDLLLQRAGRVWRHLRGGRPVPGPELLVISPDPIREVAANWYSSAFPRAAYVYRNHVVMWRSAEVLFRQRQWRIPEDVRTLVEAVYGEDAAKGFSEALEKNYCQVIGNENAEAGIADANLLKLNKGYAGQDSGWADDVRVSTRLGEESVIIRLARLDDDGQVIPWIEDSDVRRAWMLSEVGVRPRLQRDVQAALTLGWGRTNANKVLVVLSSVEQDLWHGKVVDQKGRDRFLTYSPRSGLRFHSPMNSWNEDVAVCTGQK
ncbi:CRISPR-associated endonuclease/helicase Cas3 [Azospirillaceae bacterium]